MLAVNDVHVDPKLEDMYTIELALDAAIMYCPMVDMQMEIQVRDPGEVICEKEFPPSVLKYK